MRKIYLTEMEEDSFLAAIRHIIIEELANQNKNKEAEMLLSPTEVCKLFNPSISKVTLYNWTNQGKLKKHSLGRRVFYKHSEIIAALNTLQRQLKQ